MAVYHKEDSIKKMKANDPQIAIDSLGEELAMEKFKNMQKDKIIDQLGHEVAQLKVELLLIKGGDK